MLKEAKGHRYSHNTTQPRTHTQGGFSYREDASAGTVKGHTVDRRQVSQNPLVHLHVLVHGCGHQLAESVRAVQSPAERRLHYTHTHTEAH